MVAEAGTEPGGFHRCGPGDRLLPTAPRVDGGLRPVVTDGGVGSPVRVATQYRFGENGVPYFARVVT